jgi:hypothetical protein
MPTHNEKPDTEKPDVEKLFPGGVPPQKPKYGHQLQKSKDLINYHDVVKIIERQRPPYNPKMVVIYEDQVVEKVLNKIRTDLRKLKKGD